MPSAPKREAISLCAWASEQDEPERTLMSWARKNRRGAFAVLAEFDEDE